MNDAIAHVRQALGALATADGPEGRTYAFACGYAQRALEEALDDLSGYGQDDGGVAFIKGVDAVTNLMEPIPFPEA